MANIPNTYTDEEKTCMLIKKWTKQRKEDGKVRRGQGKGEQNRTEQKIKWPLSIETKCSVSLIIRKTQRRLHCFTILLLSYLTKFKFSNVPLAEVWVRVQ